MLATKILQCQKKKKKKSSGVGYELKEKTIRQK